MQIKKRLSLCYKKINTFVDELVWINVDKPKE